MSRRLTECITFAGVEVILLVEMCMRHLDLRVKADQFAYTFLILLEPAYLLRPTKLVGVATVVGRVCVR